jgi:beta-glucanase (GH16 family)
MSRDYLKDPEVSKNVAALVTATVVLLSTTSAMAEGPSPFGDILKDGSEKWEYAAEFSDEFEGTSIDRDKWNIDTEDWGVWSWEPENAFQKDGAIHLQMVQESHKRGKNTLEYKSGIARTNRTITYGYFEARVKGCSRYPGACPAFWLYSKGRDNRCHAGDGEIAVYAEIDVVELQQCEWDSKTRKHFEVNRIDCNLHATLLRSGERQWVRPHMNPEMCKNEYDASWDPREDYHVYAVENSKEWVVWYIDGKQIAKKPNLYWHLPMHVTLSLGLRYPFVAYKNGAMVPVPEETTAEGFPTSMSVDYVRVWRNSQARPEQQPPQKKTATDMTKEEFVAMEKVKWAKNGWPWNQAKVESNFDDMDTNRDGIASGKERQLWFANKKASTKK